MKNAARELIDAAMKRHGITMDELAKRTDWSRSMLSLVYNGKRDPSQKLLASLERMMRLPPPHDLPPPEPNIKASNIGRVREESSTYASVFQSQPPEQVLRLLKKQAGLIIPEEGLSQENLACIAFIEQSLHLLARGMK